MICCVDDAVARGYSFAPVNDSITWKEFETASYNLLLRDPTRVRCTMKYCHSEANVQLKVTDDRMCLQFKTSDVQNLKKIETFYATIMKQITSSEF